MKYLILPVFLLFASMSVNAQNSVVTDIDGNSYTTVTIDTRTWMKENLRATHYRNGESISTTLNPTQDISAEENIDPLVTKDLSTPAYPTNRGSDNELPKYQWAYNGDKAYVAQYGRLYTWYAANDKRNICPEGWHVSTDVEWAELLDFLGGMNLAGGKLKEAGTAHWAEPNNGATNESGFTALGGGQRKVDGTFDGIRKMGAWWTTGPLSEYNLKSHSVFRHIEHDDPYIYRNYNYNSKVNGFSVRCVKD